MKNLLILVATAGAATAVAGTAQADYCDGKTRHMIYYATHAIPDPFWAKLRKGAEDGAQAMCLDIKWTQDVTFSVETTIERMETAITENPDMLVITATDPDAMRPTLERARDAGIPVIAVNVNDPAPKAERVPYLIYIGGDEYLGGVAAAEQVIAAGATHGVCANQAPGHIGLEARCKGFADAFEESGGSARQVDISGGAASAEAAISAHLIQSPDTDAVFTLSAGADAYGAARNAVMDAGKMGEVQIVNFDFTDEVLEHIKAGETVAAIDQQGYYQGYLPAVLARGYLDAGLMPGADVLTGPGIVNATNIEAVMAGAEAGLR